MAYQALSYIHGITIPPYCIDETVGHEGAHTAVARTLFAETEYRLMVLNSRPRETFGVRPYTAFARQLGKLPKLAIAPITAAPFELSPGDEARLTAMNYEGQEDVARRIRTATDPLLASLALPESSGPY